MLGTSFTQSAGTTVTLSGLALAGVAITAQSVSLAGNLVLDLSGVNAYNGMTLTLVNATSLSGEWDNVIAIQTSDCIGYQIDVQYTQQFAVGTLTSVSLCSSSKLFVCAVALA